METNILQETYLFKAACSELKTEVQNARKLNDEKMRRERTLLEHEVEILNQKLTQDLAQLRDELKGLFDDRRMTVRMEQRNMDTAVCSPFPPLISNLITCSHLLPPRTMNLTH